MMNGLSQGSAKLRAAEWQTIIILLLIYTLAYLDRQIRVPILHAHRIRPNFYDVGTYGGPLSQIAPAPESTAITGTATTDSTDAWINFHAETLVLPLTTTPNCNYLPPVAENDPLLDAPGNHSTATHPAMSRPVALLQ
ncbi:MAG: hypothetical protein EB152_05880, partial [Euryarchaeota archaeon]|nr:hypothetical protein [Euryarchaeota archaeon]